MPPRAMASDNVNIAPFLHPDMRLVLRLSPRTISIRRQINLTKEQKALASAPPPVQQWRHPVNIYMLPAPAGHIHNPEWPTPGPFVDEGVPLPASRSTVILSTPPSRPASSAPPSAPPSVPPSIPPSGPGSSRSSSSQHSALGPRSPSAFATTISPGSELPTPSDNSSMIPSYSTPIEELPFPKLSAHITLPPNYPHSHLLNIGVSPLDPRAPLIGLLKAQRDPIQVPVDSPFPGHITIPLPVASFKLPLNSVMLYPGAEGGATQEWVVGPNGEDLNDGWGILLDKILKDAQAATDYGVGRVYVLWMEGQWGYVDKIITEMKGLDPKESELRAYRSNVVFLEIVS